MYMITRIAIAGLRRKFGHCESRSAGDEWQRTTGSPPRGAPQANRNGSGQKQRGSTWKGPKAWRHQRYS